MVEASEYEANRARSVHTEVAGLTHPSPAPRFQRTPSAIRHGTRALGADTVSVLKASGIGDREIQELLAEGAAQAGDLEE